MKLTFVEHQYRMDNNRLFKQLFNYLSNSKTTMTWIKKAQKDLKNSNNPQVQKLEKIRFRSEYKVGRVEATKNELQKPERSV